MSETPLPDDNSLAAEKVRSFPQTPGVYLMKDAAGRVIYVGKAKNLRARAGSYFLKAAAEDPRTAKLVLEIRDIDYLDAESEIDALLMEARLIKDILPKFNRDLRDDKTFPYLEIFTHEDFPRVRFTREPKSRGTKLYGPFANPRGLRGAIQVLQKIFKFRTCTLDIDENDPRWRWFRPCLLHFDRAMHGARAICASRRRSTARTSTACSGSWKAARTSCWARCARRWPPPPQELQFEEAARLRDEIADARNARRPRPTGNARAAGGVSDRSEARAGRPAKSAASGASAADDRRASTSPTWPAPTPWPPWCSSSTGCRSSRATGGCGFSGVAGPDDTASIHEAVARRFQHIQAEGETPPDILLIDGGRGQLNAALAALALLEGDGGRRSDDDRRRRSSADLRPPGATPIVISLAKREELVFTADADEPLHLSRHSYALRLLQYVRDEAHRFAQHYHHMLRKRSQLGE